MLPARRFHPFVGTLGVVAVGTALALAGSCGSNSAVAPSGARDTSLPQQATSDAASIAVDAGPSDSSALRDAAFLRPSALPPGFEMGVALAGFQTEMGCPTLDAARCEDRGSDWYQWITTERVLNNPLMYMSKDAPSTGPGFYELYAQDIARASGASANQLGAKVFRTSFEWSRLFPRATFALSGYAAMRAAADPDALRYYHDVLAQLRAGGMRPSITVTHYSLPLWIHDGALCNQDGIDACSARGLGGWAHPDRNRIVNEIAKYAGFLGAEFGAEVDEWATENEPFSAVVVAGYLLATKDRSNPPGRSALWMSVAGAKRATMAMIEGHARMYDALKSADRVDADGDGKAARIGMVYAFSKIDPLTPNEGDARAAASAEYFFHDMFMSGVAFGKVDEDWSLGAGNGVYRSDLAGRLDWLGVNYYMRFEAQNSTVSTLPFISPLITFNLTRGFDTEAPGGLYDVLLGARRYGVPMVVSETGYVQDNTRKAAAWTVQTLEQTRRAAAAGVDVRGYYAWSLMDNYEWNHGMGMRFGLYAVDPRSKARTLRESGAVFGEMAKAHAVPPELLSRYAGVFPR